VLDVLLLGRGHDEIDVGLDGDIVVEPLLVRAWVDVDGRGDGGGVEPARRASVDTYVAPEPLRPWLVVASLH
jgi:hypothetical protein